MTAFRYPCTLFILVVSLLLPSAVLSKPFAKRADPTSELKTDLRTKPRIKTVKVNVLAGTSVETNTPPGIAFQGLLRDENGDAIADGEQSVVFLLYLNETGGDAQASYQQEDAR